MTSCFDPVWWLESDPPWGRDPTSHRLSGCRLWHNYPVLPSVWPQDVVAARNGYSSFRSGCGNLSVQTVAKHVKYPNTRRVLTDARRTNHGPVPGLLPRGGRDWDPLGYYDGQLSFSFRSQDRPCSWPFTDSRVRTPYCMYKLPLLHKDATNVPYSTSATTRAGATW
jgi:hypothetical protein